MAIVPDTFNVYSLFELDPKFSTTVSASLQFEK